MFLKRFVVKSFHKLAKLGWHICLYSLALVMAITLVFTQFQLVREGKTLLLLCIHTCSLSKYVNNWKSSFYKNARFYHDILHCLNHKCSLVLSCSTLNGLRQTSTSILEQFYKFYKNNGILKAPSTSSCHFLPSAFYWTIERNTTAKH